MNISVQMFFFSYFSLKKKKSIYVFCSFAMFGRGYTVQFGALLFLENARAGPVFGFKGLLVEGEHLHHA